MASACAFCEIVRGEQPAHVVAQDDHTLAFLDRAPLLFGHVIVATREHVETLDDLPNELVAPLFTAVRRMSVAVQKAMTADGSFVAVNTRVSQSVPHVHVHVVPRRKNDGLFSPRPIWRRRNYESDAQAAGIAAKIREAYSRSD